MQPKINILLAMVILIMMSTAPILSTDIFLPALPTIARDLKVTETAIQWFVPVFLLSLGLSQPFYGPLSDALGRRGPLLFGTVLWIASNILLFFTKNFYIWLVLRFLQGVGACSSVTIVRAIISDLFNKDQIVSVFLILGPCIAVTPALAPVLGQLLYGYFGWHSIFIFIIGFGLVLFLMILNFLPESLPDAYRRPFKFSIFIHFAWEIVRIERFWYYAVVLSFAYSVIFSYLTESPFLLIHQGFPKDKIGFTYIPIASSYIAGNFLARFFLKFLKFSMDSVIHVGSLLLAVGGILFASVLWLDPSQYLLSLAGISIMVLGNGCILPIALTCSVGIRPDLSGSASGILGFVQLLSAAAASCMIGFVTDHEPYLVGLYIATLCVLCLAIYSIWRHFGSANLRGVSP